MTHSIKHQFATVCQQLHISDGCEVTYSQVTVNLILKTVACSFRSGADGSFSTTSAVIGFGTFGTMLVVQPDVFYSPEPQFYYCRSYAEYTELIDCEFPPDDLSWVQLLTLFENIEIIQPGADGIPETTYASTDNLDQLQTICTFNDDLSPHVGPLSTIPASA